jgi:hypothetical protein
MAAMIKIANERGSVLILVLFLVVVIGVFTAPLLLTTNQGQTNAVRGENAERANYMAESSLAILKRALIVMNPPSPAVQLTQLNQFIHTINNSNLVIRYDGRDYSPGLADAIVNANGFVEVTSTGSYGNVAAAAKNVAFTFMLSNSATNAPPGIFGENLVIQGATAADLTKFKTPTASSVPAADTNTEYVPADFRTELNDHFTKVWLDVPAAETPDTFTASTTTPISAVGYLAGAYHTCTNGDYTYNTSSTSVSPSPSRKCTNNISIDSQNRTMVINGDVIAGNNITINGAEANITINGNLVAGGTISCSGNKISKLTVTGSIIATGNINFSGCYFDANSVTVGSESSLGSISSNNDITFQQIKGLSVYGSITAARNIIFKDTETKLYVKNNISSSTGTITFDGNLKALDVDGSIIAPGNIYFKLVDNHATIDGDISSNSAITFSDNVNGLVVGGSIKSQGAMLFQNVIQAYGSQVTEVKGNISSNSTLTFNTNVSGLKVGGSIKSLGNLLFRGVIQKAGSNATTISGNISSKGTVFFNTNLDYVVLEGSLIGNGITFNGTPQNNTIIKGSIYNTSPELDLVFKTNVDFNITGSIYSNRGVDFQNQLTINKLDIDGSLYAKKNVNFSGNIENLDIEGSLMSQDEQVNFRSQINKMRVDDFIAAGKKVTFQGISGNSVTLGGISSYDKVDFNGNVNGRITIDYSAPGEYASGSSSSPGSAKIQFGSWGSTK